MEAASTMKSNNKCSTEMCDVRKKGTDGMAMQQECLETWDVTAGEKDERERASFLILLSYKLILIYIIFLRTIEELTALTDTSVNITTLGLHVKVRNIILGGNCC
jgi:hypothetical protein